jgi:hypothetical protein
MVLDTNEAYTLIRTAVSMEAAEVWRCGASRFTEPTSLAER